MNNEKILLVDDEPDIIEFLGYNLTKEGFNVFTASSGKEAIEVAKQNKPDLIVCDGQGYAHPRRFGLACHLGVLFDVPTIGCGKTRLLGEADTPGKERGEITPLIDNNEIIGNVLRTQADVNPIYVSIGHRITLATACEWVLKLSPKYRLPETTRMADQLVRKEICLINHRE